MQAARDLPPPRGLGTTRELLQAGRVWAASLGGSVGEARDGGGGRSYRPGVIILGVSGSLQQKSGNLALLELAKANAPPGVEVRIFDGLKSLPHFDPDIEAAGETPSAVSAWRAAIADSDALLLASPEYGHSLPGALKNGIDWVIGSGELEGKVVAVTAAVPIAERGRLGLKALCDTLGAVSAHIVGAEPIVRGLDFEPAVRKLLAELVAAATSARLLRSSLR